MNNYKQPLLCHPAENSCGRQSGQPVHPHHSQPRQRQPRIRDGENPIPICCNPPYRSDHTRRNSHAAENSSGGKMRSSSPTAPQSAAAESHMSSNHTWRINPFIWRKSVLIIRIVSLAYHSPGVTANRGESVFVIKLRSSPSSVFILIVLLSPFMITGRHNSRVNHCNIIVMNVSRRRQLIAVHPTGVPRRHPKRIKIHVAGHNITHLF